MVEENGYLAKREARLRNKTLNLRVSQKDLDKIEFCSKELGYNKSEILRLGVEKLYEEISSKK
ncbi:hypothetical protein [Lagierella sp.]|uniref:hypothetical protein n=1 Tax=Lagierella sp. TaxID=2849657 RepID=UPI002612B9EA|nr:hypothetical protein [Lagierella sp.]